MVNPAVSGRRRFQARLRTREAIVAYLFLLPFFIFFTIFVIRSVGTAIFMSFHDWPILGANRPFIGLRNYQELFNDYVWWDALRNTFLFAVMTVFGTTIISLSCAVAVTQKIRGAGIFRVILYMPQLLSAGVIGLLWAWLLNTQFGVINYGLSFLGIAPINWLGDEKLVIPALSMVSMWWGFGFPMLIFIAGLQSIPDQLYEAARIDGGNGRQIFRYITLPLLRPTLLFVVVTGFIAHFQVFAQPFIITRGGPGRASYTAIYYLYQIAWTAFRMGYGSAVAVTMAIIIAIFTVIQFIFLGRRVEY